jgi:hypothetical protein
MQTDFWGPHAWETLHHISFGSPEILDMDDKTNYKLFYSNIKCVLPCSLCRTAFKNMIKYVIIDDYIDTRDGLCYWVFVLHNLANRKLDKKLETFADVIYKFENMRARCGKSDGSERYLKCKANVQEFTMTEAKIKAKNICEKYREISHKQIHDYYYSDKILDPKFQKCPV